MKRIALVLALLTLPSQAQETQPDIEQVTVYGGNLSGVWHVMMPSSLTIGLLGKVTWGPLREAFCRIDHDAEGYASHCFGHGDNERQGILETDGKHFHLTWGSMLARLVFDGEVTSATRFEGHFAAKVMGFTITYPDMSKADKIAIDTIAPDHTAQTDMLRAVLKGQTIAHDAALDKAIATARDPKLGDVESMHLLGHQSGPMGPKNTPDYLAVYAVEYAQGERLCWLHQNDDGKLAAFQCG